MSTKDKEILKYVQNRLYRDCFPNGYDEWKMGQDFQQAMEEVEPEQLLAQAPINLDDFVTEMN